MSKLKLIMTIAGLCMFFANVNAQDTLNVNQLIGQNGNVITTAVPFLLIAPDARGGAMGDLGAATTPDASSMHWNPAKYAFVEKDFGFAASYSPWLRALVSDINLAYVTVYKKFDDMQTVAASLRYFSLGNITFTDIVGNQIGDYKPNEFAFDATYSRKLTDKWSGAVAARYVNSNLTQGQFVQGMETKAGQSVAADVAVYYQSELNWSSMENAEMAFGLNISNIGTKISYSNATTRKDFIPTNLRMGGRLSMDVDDYNRISVMLDANKLLVPTPPIYRKDTSGLLYIYDGMDPDVSVVEGILQSWYDAPGGFSEEMREFNISLGAEYWYNKQFAVRGGYFYEDKTKGNRKYFTIGAGLRYNIFGLDFAYLIPTEQKNPLENTLRFTLSFDFDEMDISK